jgi:hypothetical protein
MKTYSSAKQETEYFGSYCPPKAESFDNGRFCSDDLFLNISLLKIMK